MVAMNKETKEMVRSLREGYGSLLSEVMANLRGESRNRRELIPLVALKEYHQFMRCDHRLALCFSESGLDYNQELDKAYMLAFNSMIMGDNVESDFSEK